MSGITREGNIGLKLSFQVERWLEQFGSTFPVGCYFSLSIRSPKVLMTWSEVPPPIDDNDKRSEEERRARMLVEKKTSINLVEAFGYVAMTAFLK